MNGRPVAPDERTQIRELYQTGLFDQRSLSDEFERSKWFVSKAVRGLPRPTNLSPRNMRERPGPPIPKGQSRKPVLLLRDLRRRGFRRPWWPGVSERCEACNGLLWLRPPSPVETGSVYCSTCGREPWEVV